MCTCQVWWTQKNIRNKGAFTVNIADEAHIAEADYFGLVSGSEVNKFDNVNMTAGRIFLFILSVLFFCRISIAKSLKKCEEMSA